MDCTDEYRRLDVRRWQGDGLLKPGNAFTITWEGDGAAMAPIEVRAQADRVILRYRHGSKVWEGDEYPVMLDWVPCSIGERRAWFLCPIAGCGRRVGHLYGGSIFACRYCHRLTYRSQLERADRRAGRRADKIRARLGWLPDIVNPAGGKPKWMHWKTYWRLVAEYNASTRESLAGMERRFGIKLIPESVSQKTYPGKGSDE
jgi:hypothetical protein